MDRKAIATAVAKVIAYVNCGKPAMAEEWVRTLVGLLGFSRLLVPVAKENGTPAKK